MDASATDQEDGEISAIIDWASDVDGDLGSGASLTIPLNAGDHVSVTVNANVGFEPVAPSNVIARDFGGGIAEVSWGDKSDNEVQFDIVRQSRHKKRQTWVGTTQLPSVPSDTTSIQDESGSGTFRYCISASNAEGVSASVCSDPVEVSGSGGGGNTGGGSFCDSHPNNKRCR